MGRVTASLASRNEHKLHELRALLPDWDIEALDTEGMPEETGSSFYENARAKARFGRMVGESERWVIGEDSGLEVDGLGGRPGIHSARYAGGAATAEANVAKLLAELAGVEDGERRARYTCELVCLSPDLEELQGSGTLDGRIAAEPRGSEGFGYDPVFIPEGQELTVAELGNEWKREHSHRARASRALLEAVRGATEAL